MLPSEAIKFKRPLRKHQADALDWFAYMREVALFWEMGTGKTTAAISWLRVKYNMAKDIQKTLIIAPVATLYNWVDEFKINAPEKVVDQCFVPYMRTRKSKFTGEERAAAIRTTDKRIVILNPESLDNDQVQAALIRFAPHNLVVDEAHRFKSHQMYSGNHKAKRPSRVARLLAISDACTNRMILTGTPILNSYLDLWSQFRILDRGDSLGTNFYSFREEFFEDKNLKWKGNAKYFPDFQPRPQCDANITKVIAAKSSRKTQKDCLDLPELMFEKRYVELGPEQSKAYFDMEAQMIAEVAGGVCAAVNALSKVNRLLQILSGHIPVEHDLAAGDRVLAYFDKNPRMDMVEELLRELTPDHKVIVWCSFQANYPRMRGVFTELGIQWAELVGGTKDRQAEIEKFRDDPDCRVMLANRKAGGVGVNMTVAKFAIDYSRDYSLGDWLQAEKRNHRDGCQIHDSLTLISLVVKDTLDEEVLEALLRKENFSENVLDRIKALR